MFGGGFMLVLPYQFLGEFYTRILFRKFCTCSVCLNFVEKWLVYRVFPSKIAYANSYVRILIYKSPLLIHYLIVTFLDVPFYHGFWNCCHIKLISTMLDFIHYIAHTLTIFHIDNSVHFTVLHILNLFTFCVSRFEFTHTLNIPLSPT